MFLASSGQLPDLVRARIGIRCEKLAREILPRRRVELSSEAMEVYAGKSLSNLAVAKLITDKPLIIRLYLIASIENGVLRFSVNEKTKINLFDRAERATKAHHLATGKMEA